MTRRLLPFTNRQGGYTLIEVIIASAIGAILMACLTSVVYTSVSAIDTAGSRIEASSQIRSFLYFAYNDFEQSGAPQACTAPPAGTCLQLVGLRATNSATPVVTTHVIWYVWDGSSVLTRQVDDGPAERVADGVTAFSWSLGGTPPRQFCLIEITVTAGAYAESQALQFFPQAQ